MKNMFMAIVIAALSVGSLQAQEYKVSKNRGRLEISEVNHVLIEGHDGNEIIFSSKNGVREKDERAEGLRALSSLGLEDNTGFGLSVVDKGDVIAVHQLKKTDGPEVKILVPRGVVVSYAHSSPYGGTLEIRNFAGELNVSTVHNGISLTNTTGMLSIRSVHGSIDASLANPPTGPVRLESVHGHVDLALPVATKANLTLTTRWGEVLVDPAFKIELDRQGELVSYSDKIHGKLNGGGAEISLIAQHNNVYLRKK